MTRATLQFFATPEDQRAWLQHFLGQAGVWCFMRQKRDVIEPLSPARLDILSLEPQQREFPTQLWIGFADLGPPVWRDSPYYLDIDLAQSQAIQYDPGLEYESRMLLSGQIAILRKSQYMELDIDPRPLKRRFDNLVKVLKRDAAEEQVFLLDPVTGTTRDCPDILITKRAVQWRKSGKLLKQFAEGRYVFDT